MKSLYIYGIACIVLALVIIYVRYSFKINPALEIIYTSMQDFTSNMLAERSPILFREQLVDPVAALEQLLRYQYFFHRPMAVLDAHKVAKVKARWSVLVANKSPTTVKLFHPNGSADMDVFINVVMKEDQALVVPISWKIEAQGGDDVRIINFHDWFTFLFV